MSFFGNMPFGGQQFAQPANPMQSAQMAMSPQQIVARAMLGPLGNAAERGGVRTADDARDIAKRGAADATLSNIGQSFNLGMGLMGGTGALKTALGFGASQLGLGVDNPFKDLAGFAKPSAAQIGAIQQGNPQQMQNQARRTAEAAHAAEHARSEAAKESRAERGRVARGV